MYVLLDSKLINCEEVLRRFETLTIHTDKNTEID